MHKKIRTAAIIGSGVMGSAIAAHLAGVGISCLLLDIVPNILTAEEEAAGLSPQHSKVRNRLATGAIAKLKKTNPAPLYSEVFADRITPGNLEDHLSELAKVDWIIEVVVERLDVKKSLLATIESVWTPGTIVSSNTSGISINEMVSDRSDAFKAHFLGTHFFNPPRYMKLLEIIPGEQTNAEIVKHMSEFCEKSLGKGVVIAKDTPNFIANRIGTYGLMATLSEMLEKGYTVEEIEAVTGPAMGRPKSATFRTLDLVGLDTFVHVAQNVYDHVNTEEEKKIFHIPDVLCEMVARGWTGEKNGQGFYKKVKDESGKQILALNLTTLEYAPTKKVSSASLEASKAAKGTAAKVKALISANDRYSELAWNLLKPVLLYSAQLLGEIADSIVEIDNAMKWGFNWNLGPFELWDAIGLEKSVQRMESEGNLVPVWVKEWIANGHTSFYKREPGSTFYYSEGKYKGIESNPEIISLKSLKEQNKVIISNSGASLIDIGDDVACLEFHSNNNAIGEDILSMISKSVDEARNNYRGLVLANEGRHFCVGANLMLLLMEIQDDEWDEVNHIIKTFQDTMMKLKWFEKPVVAAPHSMTLGGGVEACLPADQIAYSAETYFGLVEVGVGLIPAGGGCKEVALMASKHLPNPEHDLQPLMNQYFETIGMAKVSTSGHDTKRLGFMRSGDFVVVNQDYRVHEAKQAVLRMDAAGYKIQLPEKIRVVGDTGKALMQAAAYTMRQSGYISKHDQLIAGKLAHVLAGGNVPAGTYVTEQYMLDLEREAFMSLCGEPKTQQRMQSLLTTGKAVRN